MSLPAIVGNPLRFRGTASRLRVAALALLAAGTLIAASPLHAQQVAPDSATETLRVRQTEPLARTVAGTQHHGTVATPNRPLEARPLAARPLASGPLAPVPLVQYAPESRAPLPDERQDESSSFRRNLALIGVGVGAILIGSELVDGGSGTVLVLGGAGLSLYGLYQILQ